MDKILEAEIGKFVQVYLDDIIIYSETWEEKQQQAMDILKKAIIEDAVLKYPNFTKPFILYTDASGGGLGAVLSQLDENEVERPIAFASKTFMELKLDIQQVN